MKKILKSIVAILLIISSIFTLVSCARPKKDIDEAADNLRDNGYTVTFYSSDENGAGIADKISAYKTTYDGTLRLQLVEFESTKLAKLYYQALRIAIQEKIKENKLSIKAMKHMINKFKDDLSSDEISSYKQMIVDLKAENKELREQLNCTGRSGKYVWQGDLEAIKATK